MLENSFIFSLLISFVNTFFLYLFTNKQRNIQNENEKNNELMLSFFVTFAACFLVKSITNTNNPVKQISGESLLSHSTRPPF